MKKNDSEWYFTDDYEPEFLWTGTETVRVESEGHLVHLLKSFSHKEPRLVLLRSPQGSLVSIAVGGSLAGVEFYDDPQSGVPVTAKPRQSYSDKDIWFVAEGQPAKGEANTLMPVDQMIEIVTYIYRTHQLPGWVDWA
jgi:hypothetical protein